MPKKTTKAFNWKGEQGEYVRQEIASGKMPPNPTKEEYKVVYEASSGDVLKFQNFHSSWKNVQRNLSSANEVVESTGARRIAAAGEGLTAPPTTPGRVLTPPRFGVGGTPATTTALCTPRSTACPASSKKGMLKAEGDLYWPTLHSYWHDKDKNLRLCFFVVLPSSTRAKDISVSIVSNGTKIKIVYKWPEFLFDPERLFEGQIDRSGASTSNVSSSKAAGLVETKEAIKTDD